MKVLIVLLGLIGATIDAAAQATLPEEVENRERRVSEMVAGDEGWTVPWAMFADRDGKLWINGNYALSDAPAGADRILVQKNELGEIVVDARRCRDKSWRKGGGGFSGDFHPIPVHEVVW